MIQRSRRPKPCLFLKVHFVLCPLDQVGMNGDTFSIKAPKECSKKFAATFTGIFLTRRNVLRIFFLFLEDLGAPLWKRCRHSGYSD